MDSSNRVAFILGQDVRVDAREMTAGEWVEVIAKVAKKAKPQLKYIPDFKPLVEYADAIVYNSLSSKTDSDDVKRLFASKHTDWKVKCIFLGTVEYTRSQEKIELHTGFHAYKQFPKSIRLDRMFFSNKGEFILWGASYDVVVTQDPDYRPYQVATYQLVTSAFCLLELSESENLRSFVKEHKFLAENVLKSIYGGIDKYCLETKKRLEDIEQTRNELSGIMSRVKWPEK